MNKLEQAARQALGALVRAEAMYGQPNADIQTALREALAEPQTTTPDVCGEVCARAKLCYGCNKDLEEVNAKYGEQAEQELVRKWPLMGYGDVAIGCSKQPDGTTCLLYLDMGEIREIGADTTDLFPVGSAADPSKLMACIRFKDGGAIQQTIDVLQEMQVEIGYAAPARTKDLTDDEIAALWASDGFYRTPTDFARAVIAADRRKNK